MHNNYCSSPVASLSWRVSLTEHKFIPSSSEWTTDDDDEMQEDVRVAAFRLTCAGAVKVPHRAIYSVAKCAVYYSAALCRIAVYTTALCRIVIFTFLIHNKKTVCKRSHFAKQCEFRHSIIKVSSIINKLYQKCSNLCIYHDILIHYAN